jgi:hypothetical protein
MRYDICAPPEQAGHVVLSQASSLSSVLSGANFTIGGEYGRLAPVPDTDFRTPFGSIDLS